MILGHSQPRLVSGLNNHESLGDQLISFTESLGFEVDDWQRYFFSEIMRHDNGRFVARQIGLLVARQNGKSFAARMRLLFGVYVLGESWVGLAQKLELADEHLDWAIDLIESNDWLMAETKKISLTNGKRGIFAKNGGKWVTGAATAGGVRGKTGNLWIDEVREIKPSAYAASTPITRAVANAQTLLTSNAGDAHSQVLNRIRSSALAANNPKLLWLEWSADPNLAITDKEAWAQANPNLGGRVDVDQLELSLLTDTPEDFRTEALCLFVDAIMSPWAYDSVNAAADESLEMNPELTTFWGLDVSPSRKRADLVGCQWLPNGRIGFAIAQSWQAESVIDDLQVADETAEIVRKFNSHVVAFDKWTAASIAQRLHGAGIRVSDTSGAAFAQACDEMQTGLNSGRLIHDGDPELIKHFNACGKRDSPTGGWRVIRSHAATDITAACAAIMAAFHANKNDPSAETFAF
jgi:phage terminase large subunit-like protein